MIQVYKIDSQGFYVEPIIINNGDVLPPNYVAIKPPDGLYKAQFVSGQWVEGLDEASLLSNAKTAKKFLLQQAFQASLLKGFTSSADGTSRTYAIDPVAMQKWTGALSVINSGKVTSNLTVRDFDGNTVTLTPAQFQQMAADGFTYFNSQEAHLWSLESDADEALSVPDVNNLTW